MPKLLHSVKIEDESIPAGTEVEYLDPAVKAGKFPPYRERVWVRLPSGREVRIDASAVDAHSFETSFDAERLRAGYLDVPCEACGEPVDPTETWHATPNGAVICEDCAETAWWVPEHEEQA